MAGGRRGSDGTEEIQLYFSFFPLVFYDVFTVKTLRAVSFVRFSYLSNGTSWSFFRFFRGFVECCSRYFSISLFFSLVAANSHKYTLQLQIREGRKEDGKLFIYFA